MNQIITARPKTMSFGKYKKLRREQMLRGRRRRKSGILVYVASQIVEAPASKLTGERTRSRQTFMPAVKTFDKYGNVKYVPMKKKEIK